MNSINKDRVEDIPVPGKTFSAGYDLRRRGTGVIAEEIHRASLRQHREPLDFDSKPVRLSVCTNPKVTSIAQFSSEIVKTTAKKK